MREPEEARRFEALVSSHLDAAYNLARWLTRDPNDAQDCVQDALLRALRFFGSFRGGDGRAWLLTIVRNSCYSFLKQRRGHELLEYDEDQDSLHDSLVEESSCGGDPEALLLRVGEARRMEAALLALPAEFREILVLRELEELSYKQIADVLGLPIGTVMSRLSRARERLRRQLMDTPA